MKSFLATLFENNASDSSGATVILNPFKIKLGYNNSAGLHTTKQWNYSDVSVQFFPSENKTKVTHNPSKAFFYIDKNVVSDLNEAISYDKKSWLRKKIDKDFLKVSLFFIGIIAALIGLYFWLVPYCSEQLGRSISKDHEAAIGQKMFKSMVDTTKTDVELTELVNEYYQAMAISTEYKIKITVIKDPTVNAFAIMGGNIVVYTGLLQRLKTHEELAALLCHEFTHVNKQHSTRSVFRQLGSAVFLSLLLGDMGSVGSVVIDNADKLNSLGYSRSLEREADIEGLALINQRALNGEGFERLLKQLKASGDGNVIEILSSHPDIDNRIEYIKKDKNYNTGKPTALNDELNNLFKAIRGDSDF